MLLVAVSCCWAAGLGGSCSELLAAAAAEEAAKDSDMEREMMGARRGGTVIGSVGY